MTKSCSVYFLLPFFECGGVEAWSSYASQSLINSGYKVSIYTLSRPNYSPKFFGASSAPIIHCPNFLAFCLLVIRHSRYEKVTVISALTRCNLLCLIFFLFPHVSHVSSVHLTLKKVSEQNTFRFLVRVFLHQLILFFSSKIIAVSKGVRDDLVNLTFLSPLSSSKVVVIYNPCFSLSRLSALHQTLEAQLAKSSSKCKFVCAGRFHSQKGMSSLITAVSLLPNHILELSDFTLIGDGPLSDQLQYQVENLGLTHKIHFVCFQSDLVSHFCKYDAFILPSVYEGFGNVLAEALFAGLLCIAFDCPHGPSEILNNGTFGLLVPPGNVEKLSGSISEVCSQEFRESRLSNLLYPPHFSRFRTHLSSFTDTSFSASFISLLRICHK